MINFITPYKDMSPQGAGVTERLEFWRAIKRKYSDANWFHTNPQVGSKFLKIWKTPIQLHRFIQQVKKSENKNFIFIYPSFPAIPYLSIFRMKIATRIFNFIKDEANKRGGHIGIRVTDLPRLAGNGTIKPLRVRFKPDKLKEFEKMLMDKADIVWVTSQSQIDWLSKDVNLPKDKLSLSINGTQENVKDASPINLDDVAHFRFVYSGVLKENKNIEWLIKEFLKIADNTSVILYLTGPFGNWINREYDHPKVKYLGNLPTPKDVAEVVKSCDVGLIVYARDAFSDLMCPNKLSFYITCVTPILTTDIEETARQVRELNIGTVAPLKDFADAMRELINKKEVLSTWRKNMASVREEFFWPRIYEKALNEFERL